MYGDDTTYLFESGITLGLVETRFARVALIATVEAGAGESAEAPAQPEAGATEEWLLVNDEYQWMIEN